MKADISHVDIWAAGIKDQPGGLVKKLGVLTEAGANLQFLLARRAPDKPGTGVVFATPVNGARQEQAAKQAGFKKTKSLNALRIVASDKPGLGLELVRTIAAADINLRGLSAAVVGKRAIFYLAFDSAADTTKAMYRLKQTL